MNPTNCARSRSTPTASALYRDRDDVPTESLVLTDALPQAPNATWAEADIPAPQEQIAASGLTGAQQMATASAKTSTLPGSARRKGANAARIQFRPERSWEVNAHMHAGMP
jgi:catalase (peroxidase I)